MYPVMPVHGEGSAVWKELESLKDIVMNLPTHSELLRQKPVLSGSGGSSGDGSAVGLVLETSPGAGGHVHEIELNHWEVEYVKNGKILDTTTEEGDTNEENMHQHNVKVMYKRGQFILARCDKMKWRKGCGDGHSAALSII